jgi:hypothetical protein
VSLKRLSVFTKGFVCFVWIVFHDCVIS